MFDLTSQEKKVLIALGAFAVLGLAVLAYRTYLARPEFKVAHSVMKPAAAAAININTADAAKIETLPGIGPKLSKDIVDYRAEHGSFLLKEDLRKVRGIGEDKYNGIKDLIALE